MFILIKHVSYRTKDKSIMFSYLWMGISNTLKFIKYIVNVLSYLVTTPHFFQALSPASFMFAAQVLRNMKLDKSAITVHFYLLLCIFSVKMIGKLKTSPFPNNFIPPPLFFPILHSQTKESEKKIVVALLAPILSIYM